MKNYETIKTLGEGGYGKAILVRRKSDNELFVVKEIKLAKLSEQEKKEAKMEVKVLKALKHPNIVSYIESFEENGALHIVMEYADGGDLQLKIKKRAPKLFPESEILHDFTQLALAITYIHDRKILQRDLKCQHIFLTKNGQVKLGDFGIAKVLDHTFQLCKTQIGTPYYLSPEMCEGKNYNTKTDVWSLGCILYEQCTLKHAFDGRNINNLLVNIVRGKFSPIPSQYSDELRRLVNSMLTKDPKNRPSINEILMMPIIRKSMSNFLSELEIQESLAHSVLHGRDPLKGPTTKFQPLPPVHESEPEPIQPVVTEVNNDSQQDQSSAPEPQQQPQRQRVPYNYPNNVDPRYARLQEIKRERQRNLELKEQERLKLEYEQKQKALEQQRYQQQQALEQQKLQQQQALERQRYQQQALEQQRYQQKQALEQQKIQRLKELEIQRKKEIDLRRQREIQKMEQQRLLEQRQREAHEQRIKEQKMKEIEQKKLREQRQKELEEQRRAHEQKLREIEEARARQREAALRARKEMELRRQKEEEERARKRREEEKRRMLERIKHDEEIAARKAEFAEKERLKNELREQARRIAEEKWKQAEEEARNKNAKKYEDLRRQYEERQQQQMLQQQQYEQQQQILQQQRIQEQQQQQKLQEQQQQMHQQQVLQEQQQQMTQQQRLRDQQQQLLQQQKLLEQQIEQQQNQRFKQNQLIVSARRQDLASKSKLSPNIGGPRVALPNPRRDSYSHNRQQQKQLQQMQQRLPSLEEEYVNYDDSFYQNKVHDTPEWSRRSLAQQAEALQEMLSRKKLAEQMKDNNIIKNLEQREINVNDVIAWQKDNQDMIQQHRKMLYERANEQISSIKEALNLKHAQEYQETVDNNAYRTYYTENGQHVLPVARDPSSLVQRAEKIASIIEDRIGHEKLLQIRRELLYSDNSPSLAGVPPDLQVMIVQLMNLEEHTGSSSHS